GTRAAGGGKCPLIVVGLAHVQAMQLDRQRSGGVLHGCPTLPAYAMTLEGSHARAAGHRLLQQFQSLLVEIQGHGGHSCAVRAGRRTSGNESCSTASSEKAITPLLQMWTA